MKDKKIFIASDHAGYNLKENIKKELVKKNKKIMDLGPKNSNSVDYPKFAHLLSKIHLVQIRKNKIEVQMSMAEYDKNQQLIQLHKEQEQLLNCQLVEITRRQELPLSKKVVCN